MIETAFVLVVLLAMIIFVIDIGRILLIQQFMTERARTAARTAAVNNWDSATVANFLCYNQTTAPGGITTTPGLLGILPAQVSYASAGAAGTPTYRLTVQVRNVTAFMFIPGLAGQFSLPPISVTVPFQSNGATD
jgi:Flp pilus assembly protein TadG